MANEKEFVRVPFYDGKKSGNNFRFMPGRVGRDARDTQVAFRSLPYVRVITDEKTNTFATGAVLGPTREVPLPAEQGSEIQEVQMGVESKLIGIAQVKDESDAVRIRPFVTPEDEKKPKELQHVKKYIDWASFQSLPLGDAVLVKYLGNRTINVEVWTGNFVDNLSQVPEESFQIVDFFVHGSIALDGGRNVARARKKIIDPNDSEATQKLGRRAAKLVAEEHGEIIGGSPVWSVKTWEMEYTTKSSEIVLVRNRGMYYKLAVDKGEALLISRYTDNDAKKWEQRFIAQLAADLYAEQTKAAIDAGIAKQAQASAA